MHVYGEISGRLTPEARLSGRITPQERIRGNITIPAKILPEEYHGSYDIIPGSEAQILETGEHWLPDNIIIEPIPNNYGLITWDGSVITVS